MQRRLFSLEGDAWRVAHALWLLRAFHEAGGPGAEPEPHNLCARLAEEAGVSDEYRTLCDRLGVTVVVKRGRRRRA